MKDLIERLEPMDRERDCLNVIVETPKGSRVKYSYDPESGLMILSKTLPEGMVFPFNFGFVHRTLCDDGDPLDVLVVNDEPMIAGCFLKVQPLGVIQATQTEGGKTIRNDRVIGRAMTKEKPVAIRGLSVDRLLALQIELFFATYNRFYGKEFRVIGTAGAAGARKVIRQAIELARRREEEQVN